MSDLIDTTEMYLKCILEMVEDDVIPTRSKLVTRLGQAAPSVSQTVERMTRENLLSLDDNRQIVLSKHGMERAVSVMRKHRIAESFLFYELGFGWAQCHEEACRWEHVMGDEAEAKMLHKLEGKPNPYGNPIPGLATRASTGGVSSTEILHEYSGEVDSVSTTIHSLGEQLQVEESLLEQFDTAGVRPGQAVTLSRTDGFVRITSQAGAIDLSDDAAQHLFVTR
jgi:DtxR family transcriptional regulator, Mn-dependent transcriptional regulator